MAMDRRVAFRDRRTMWWVRRGLAGLAVVLALAIGAAAPLAAQPPQTTAAQDGFLPVDESKPQEHLPAAPLVMTAYGVAWVAILGYVWSLWSRLGKVEREIAEVSRRIDAGSRH
jgi:CcmD family protein